MDEAGETLKLYKNCFSSATKGSVDLRSNDVGKSPPCSFYHTRSLLCSTDPGENRGVAGDRTTSSHLPAGSQTAAVGDSLCPSVEETYKRDVLLRIRSCNIKNNKIYLSADMTGQEGSTKHQIPHGIHQDGVTTESGLLIGQEVDSILV